MSYAFLDTYKTLLQRKVVVCTLFYYNGASYVISRRNYIHSKFHSDKHFKHQFLVFPFRSGVWTWDLQYSMLHRIFSLLDILPVEYSPG